MKGIIFKRFLRTFLPQVPALFAYIAGVQPEYTAILVLLGSIATAVDKYLREIKFY